MTEVVVPLESVPQADAAHVGLPHVTPDESPLTVAVMVSVCCCVIVAGVVLGVTATEICAVGGVVVVELPLPQPFSASSATARSTITEIRMRVITPSELVRRICGIGSITARLRILEESALA